MPLNKQSVNINFGQGLDLKTDPNQVSLGKFLSMQNSVFTKGGLLQKRNGYGMLDSLPNTSSNYLTTFNTDLTAIGNNLEAYASGAQNWVDRGTIQPIQLGTMPLIRNNTNQSQCDTAISPNGYICTVYTDQIDFPGGTAGYYYTIADSTTGQTIIAPTQLNTANATYGTPRVFLLGNYFIILFTVEISTVYHLQYIAIHITNPSMVSTPADIATAYTPATTVAFDGAIFNNGLYIAYNGASTSGIKVVILYSNLTLSSTINPDASHVATLVSVCADAINQVIWVSYFDTGTSNAYAFALSPFLAIILSATEIIASTAVVNITSQATNGVMTFIFEITNPYPYDSGIPTNIIDINTITQSGTVGSAIVLKRSVGLASKAVTVNGIVYVLVSYFSPYQSTYFLINGSGNIISKLAYGNGCGYLTLGLPNALINGNEIQIPYLIKDLIQAVNKNTNVPSGSQVNGIYAQHGINLASFTLSTDVLFSAEIGTNLNISGGFLWGYDGYTPVENGFFVYPDSIEAVANTGVSGSMTEQQYFYQVTYEWSDNQGNLFRSAPSIPVTITLTSGQNATSVSIPTLRLTYKTANPVKICVYRWSAAQQVYYQTSSIFSPILNDPTIDNITFVDKNSDSDILGNNILYTTGGVVENINGPAFDSVFLFDDRLWGITSEDKNLLWYSKQVIEATPVEMSDLFTLYVAPSIGAQGSTGPLKCGASMDDKLILFKESAINYINGTGPDNTGANSQYSQPIFITSTVGCNNQRSIVFQPQGLMFEFSSPSGNQIWLLGRDLSSQYIGAPVEALTLNANIQSAVNIPGTNQVRFTLDSGITITYDYYYSQWNTFTNVPAISSTLYQGLHTYINSFGQVFQETEDAYLDGSQPVLMSFTTSWIHLAELQGYQRAYYFYLLGKYYSPHKLNIQIAYDYNPSLTQQSTITPSNYSPNYGQDFFYGSGNPYAGPGPLEQWRVFFSRQRCQAFQLTVSEIYDPTYGVAAGQGLSLSGINVVIGVKNAYRPITADHSVG